MIRKFTLSLTFFVALISFVSMAQPGLNPVFPYFQNFDTLIAGQSIEEQAGWYVDMIPTVGFNAVEVSAARGINGSQAMSINLNDNFPSDSTTSPLIGPLTANTIFGYSYRIVNGSGQAHSLTGNAGLKIIFKQSTSFNWVMVDSISLSNHIDSADYQRREIQFGSFNFMNGNFRFVFNQGTPGDDFFIDIDSLVIYDPTITNSKLISAASNDIIISCNEWNQITISNKGIESNTQIFSIYNTEGKLVHSGNLRNTITGIDASQWTKGMYFVQTGKRNQKIVIR